MPPVSLEPATAQFQVQHHHHWATALFTDPIKATTRSLTFRKGANGMRPGPEVMSFHAQLN